MTEKHEDRLIHVACDVPPHVFGPLLLLLHDCRVENLQTIIPERGTARVHHKQALALPKPGQKAADRPWGEKFAQRQDVRRRLLAALSEYPDGITAADMRAKHFPDYKGTLTVSVPMDRLYRQGVLGRSPDRPHHYWLEQGAGPLAKPAKPAAGGSLSETIVSVIRQHPAGLSSAQVRELAGASDRRHQVFTCLGALFKRGTIHRAGDRTKGFTYLPRTAS